MKTYNAKIESTMLGVESHGIMSFLLNLSYGKGGGCQSFGGYTLDSPLKDSKGNFIKRVGSDLGMDLIMRVLDVVGVSKWEDLPGKHIRVQRDSKDQITAIGHLTDEEWLDIECYINDFLKNTGSSHGK